DRLGGNKSTASRPADGASATASAASPADSSAADQGAAGPRRRIPPGPPSPASAWGSAAAAPPPPGEAPAARHPSTLKHGGAATSSQPIGRASDRASAGSRTSDTASRPTAAAGEPAGQLATPGFGTLQAPLPLGTEELPGDRISERPSRGQAFHQ